MSYFPDLTPHTYTDTDGLNILNIGWLDAAYSFQKGEPAAGFLEALRELCAHPVKLHRGFHDCQFCPGTTSGMYDGMRANGQIRIMAATGSWYAAPRLIYHYVTVHHYAPPAAFVETVLCPAAVAKETR